MGLFSFSKNKKERIIPGQRIDRLDANGELPYGWHYANRNFTQKLESKYRQFSHAYYSAKRESKGVLAEYSALKSLVLYMEDTQRLCYSMGECFAKWSSFSVADPSTIYELKQELNRLENNIDELIKKEQTIKKLKTDLLKIIKEEPGVVQSDLYKRFDPQLKFEISNQLYMLSASGTIVREKSGRSYKLYIC